MYKHHCNTGTYVSLVIFLFFPVVCYSDDLYEKLENYLNGIYERCDATYSGIRESSDYVYECVNNQSQREIVGTTNASFHVSRPSHVVRIPELNSDEIVDGRIDYYYEVTTNGFNCSVQTNFGRAYTNYIGDGNQAFLDYGLMKKLDGTLGQLVGHYVDYERTLTNWSTTNRQLTVWNYDTNISCWKNDEICDPYEYNDDIVHMSWSNIFLDVPSIGTTLVYYTTIDRGTNWPKIATNYVAGYLVGSCERQVPITETIPRYETRTNYLNLFRYAPPQVYTQLVLYSRGTKPIDPDLFRGGGGLTLTLKGFEDDNGRSLDGTFTGINYNSYPIKIEFSEQSFFGGLGPTLVYYEGANRAFYLPSIDYFGNILGGCSTPLIDEYVAGEVFVPGEWDFSYNQIPTESVNQYTRYFDDMYSTYVVVTGAVNISCNTNVQMTCDDLFDGGSISVEITGKTYIENPQDSRSLIETTTVQNVTISSCGEIKLEPSFYYINSVELTGATNFISSGLTLQIIGKVEHENYGTLTGYDRVYWDGMLDDRLEVLSLLTHTVKNPYVTNTLYANNNCGSPPSDPREPCGSQSSPLYQKYRMPSTLPQNFREKPAEGEDPPDRCCDYGDFPAAGYFGSEVGVEATWMAGALYDYTYNANRRGYDTDTNGVDDTWYDWQESEGETEYSFGDWVANANAGDFYAPSPSNITGKLILYSRFFPSERGVYECRSFESRNVEWFSIPVPNSGGRAIRGETNTITITTNCWNICYNDGIERSESIRRYQELKTIDLSGTDYSETISIYDLLGQVDLSEYLREEENQYSDDASIAILNYYSGLGGTHWEEWKYEKEYKVYWARMSFGGRADLTGIAEWNFQYANE